MLLAKEMERELQRLNMEEACGRSGEGVTRPRYPLTPTPPQLKEEKQRGMGPSWGIVSMKFCIPGCHSPLLEGKVSYKEPIKLIHRLVKTALQISNSSWFLFICNCVNIRDFSSDKTGDSGRPCGGEPMPTPQGPHNHFLSVASRCCYLDLRHQLHSPDHLDENLLLEGHWAADLDSRQTRLLGEEQQGAG